jgi:hypothetical protein
MNHAANADFRTADDAGQGACVAGAQLKLAFVDESQREVALRAAWKRSRLHLPYQVALRSRPLAICLNCLAEAMQKRAQLDGSAYQRRPRRARRVSR